MTEAEVRRLSHSLQDGVSIVVVTRDGTTYAGSPVALPIDTAAGVSSAKS